MLLPILYLFLGSICVASFSVLRKKYQQISGKSIFQSVLFITTAMVSVFLLVILLSLAFGQFGQIANITPLTFGLGTAIAICCVPSALISVIGTAFGSLPILMTFAYLGLMFMSSIYDFALGYNTISNNYVASLIFIAVVIAINVIEGRKAEGEVKKNSRIFSLLCILLFFTNGSVLIFYKIFTNECSSFGQLNFIGLYAVLESIIAGIIVLIMILVNRKRKIPFKEVRPMEKKCLLIIVAYSLFFIGSEYLALNTTALLPISIQSPLSFAISIITITIFDAIVTKAKIKDIQIVQIAAAIFGAVLISM